MNFQDYLIKQFQNNYQWIDDGWPDAEAKWYSNIDDDDLLFYFENWMYEEQGIYIEYFRATHRDKIIKFIRSLM